MYWCSLNQKPVALDFPNIVGECESAEHTTPQPHKLVSLSFSPSEASFSPHELRSLVPTPKPLRRKVSPQKTSQGELKAHRSRALTLENNSSACNLNANKRNDGNDRKCNGMFVKPASAVRRKAELRELACSKRFKLDVVPPEAIPKIPQHVKPVFSYTFS
jgi:hypothetical protein